LEQATLECDDPVLFIESKACYGRLLSKPPEGMSGEKLDSADATFPTLYFKWLDAEPDGLFCCYGAMAPIMSDALQSLAESEGLYFDLAVFSQLSPTPIGHLDQLLDRRPALCLVAEEASPMAGWSAEIVASLEERRAERGDQNIRYVRVGARHEPIGSGRRIEQHTLPDVVDVVSSVLTQF
jgi:pyruvate/2-oxoglutarate/acetoin dehydrogenase E1 component